MASITWRDGIAYAVWWIKVDGAWKQKRRTLETRNPGVALRRLSQLEKELEAERWGETPKPVVLFEAACQAWVVDHLPNLRPKAALRYEVALVNLRAVLAGTPIDAISRARLMDFELARRRAGVTTSTIRRDLACLSSLLSYCIEREWIEMNPVSGFVRPRRRPGLKEGRPRTRHFSKEEERRILAAATPKPPRKRPAPDAIVFAIETGLRCEEQFSAKWHQVRWGLAPMVHVEGKGGQPRDVPLTQRALEILTRLRRVRPHAKPDDYIFAHADGSRFRNLDKAFRAACARAGLADVQWHDLRRTCGCRLLQERGFSIEQVQAWLGHKDVKTTQRSYAFLNIRRRAAGGRNFASTDLANCSRLHGTTEKVP